MSDLVCVQALDCRDLLGTSGEEEEYLGSPAGLSSPGPQSFSAPQALPLHRAGITSAQPEKNLLFQNFDPVGARLRLLPSAALDGSRPTPGVRRRVRSSSRRRPLWLLEAVPSTVLQA